MKVIRLASKLIGTLFKDRMHYPDKLVVDTFSLFARCGVLLLLYSYVYKYNGGQIRGTTFAVVAWSMFFYFVVSNMRLRSINQMIMQDVKSGNIEVLLNKPISYLPFRYMWQFGLGLFSFVVLLPAGSVLLSLLVGIPETMKTGVFLPSLVIVFILGTILTFLLYSLVGLLSFWIEDVKPVYWILDKAVMILGGSYVPVALFPPLLYKMAVYSPFGASMLIGQTVYVNWVNNWWYQIIWQIIWIAIFMVLVYFLYARAKVRVSVNGG